MKRITGFFKRGYQKIYNIECVDCGANTISHRPHFAVEQSCKSCPPKQLAKHKHPLYFTYMNMIYRCNNPDRKDYKYYGAKGVTVCKEWLDDFWQFVADVGERPEGKTLDRVNSKGNYEPGNIQWATRKEQNQNRFYYRYATP